MQRYRVNPLAVLIALPMVFPGAGAADMARDHERVAELLGRMTLAEKIGQMAQVNSAGSTIPVELGEAIRNGRIGSILNEVDVGTVNEQQRIAVEESRHWCARAPAGRHWSQRQPASTGRSRR